MVPRTCVFAVVTFSYSYEQIIAQIVDELEGVRRETLPLFLSELCSQELANSLSI